MKYQGYRDAVENIACSMAIEKSKQKDEPAEVAIPPSMSISQSSIACK